MTRSTAEKIWGAEAVHTALSEPAPEPVTESLLSAIEKHADPPGAFRAWSLSQPWPRFCAIVHVVSGSIDGKEKP